MISLSSQLNTLSDRLERALLAQDWQAVKLLDEELRSSFGDISAATPVSADDPALINALRRLSDTYRRVVGACEQHRAEIKNQLVGLQRGKRGVHAYRSV